jgi:hypothetical protein
MYLWTRYLYYLKSTNRFRRQPSTSSVSSISSCSSSLAPRAQMGQAAQRIRGSVSPRSSPLLPQPATPRQRPDAPLPPHIRRPSCCRTEVQPNLHHRYLQPSSVLLGALHHRRNRAEDGNTSVPRLICSLLDPAKAPRLGCPNHDPVLLRAEAREKPPARKSPLRRD